ncbi:helix-turn-helix domain-containing protein [Epilithonimonas ginsengisoli]|uniref:Helix-turn-helix domain-containing protein n=1 Tax=Epilithonimonas ginsengisoli TaxID=1245592 RepID=A0ABU4JIH8_9FLAO|nr:MULTISPECIES: helix-turn-helix domain-containing protein [Chryseobacterium group]MBV6878819.1 helix-turn-helix domain-containing protein [Epilithonimonas sp. FP105]MDW8549422.1 helix-turn-helix domain-containing protein [Epilithonimonas ginsengisoli]OAH71696.1 transcriptional regulator [Chryseobacterium sp. FP211-J200]HBV17506.1 DNA-binding protein [Chryseobacterium carnipullorum]
MTINILTKDDLDKFKNELIQELSNMFHIKTTEQKLWLRTSEVKDLLNISSGTLQNLRANRILSCSKVGGILYYNYKDIEKLLSDRKSS